MLCILPCMGGGLKYGKNGISSNGPNTFLFIHAIFIILT